jgi:hypothetical protein
MKFTRLSGALLAVALPFAVTGVADASPGTTLMLAVASADGSGKSVSLGCYPPDGTHPNAKRACAELVVAQGDFDALPGQQEPAFCTMEYQPVTAVAYGMWRGEPVRWVHEYGNACSLRASTGTVFLF